MLYELILLSLLSTCTATEEFRHWWHYCGIYGPDMWSELRQGGVWSTCKDGNEQSPINLQADRLIYDHGLTELKFEGNDELSGDIVNTGRHLQFVVHENSKQAFKVFGGPLTSVYILTTIRLHFGNTTQRGSEHLVNGKAFPGEVQLMFYNEKYEDYNAAEDVPNGLAVISIFTQLGNTTNTELDKLTSQTVLKQLVFADTKTTLRRMNVGQLLPITKDYITYRGSLTTPPCSETVQWMILNRPIYIEADKFSHGLRELRTDTKGSVIDNSAKGKMMNNFRPPAGTGNRILRTNIFAENPDQNCPVSKRVVVYKVNEAVIAPSNTKS